jgi:hypothetical protein
LIMGGDILEAEGFNSLYESNKFMWHEIQVVMVPRGHWSRDNVEEA